MGYTKIIQRADEIAVLAHEGQKCWGGEPYITHPREVEAILVENRLKLGNYPYPTSNLGEREMAMLRCVAKLHDVFEDNEAYRKMNFGDFVALWPEVTDNYFLVSMWDELKAITKREDLGEDYVHYIFKVKNRHYAKIVKLADLQHNLSNMKPGSMRDKYMLAACVLTDRNVWS